MSDSGSAARIRVFVHLAYGFGAARWLVRWRKGEIVGLNERLPYGYFLAESDGCIVTYSEDKTERALERLFRRGVRFVLGFDFVHAWRNRKAIHAADVIWTHTESQHLAALLLLRIFRGARRPKIIAQSIWLFDQWPEFSRLRRRFYEKLLADADLLTVHSPENLRVARTLFPRQRSEMVPFGIDIGRMRPMRRRAACNPVHVLSLGNDRHRDWSTLIGAVGGRAGYVLRIVSPTVDRSLLRGMRNIDVVRCRNNDELATAYEWADIVVVALKPNLHASGITVVQEATLFGVPVICTDTGGLRAYFSDGEVRFVPPYAHDAIRNQITALAAADDERGRMVERARRRILAAELSSRRFAQRHAELSRELLGFDRADDSVLKAAGQRTAAACMRDASQMTSGRLFIAAGLLFAAGMIAPPPRAAASRPGSPAASLNLCKFEPSFSENFNTLSVLDIARSTSEFHRLAPNVNGPVRLY